MNNQWNSPNADRKKPDGKPIYPPRNQAKWNRVRSEDKLAAKPNVVKPIKNEKTSSSIPKPVSMVGAGIKKAQPIGKGSGSLNKKTTPVTPKMVAGKPVVPVPNKGKPKKTSQQRKKMRNALIKKSLLAMFALFLLVIIAGCTLFIVAYLRLEVPEASKFASAQTTTVYATDAEAKDAGENQTVLLGKFAERNRTIVDTTKFPHTYLADAVVASEDQTFYENNGVDLKGIVRALWNNIQGKPRQGASTLTQQYVENYYTGKNTSYTGKFRETILALKINRTHSKERILNDYLNTIYFGRGTYGVESAAQAYFGKSAADLDLAQSAFLSAIIPAPNTLDPARNPVRSKARWDRVLNRMVEIGKLTKAERDKLKFPEVLAKKEGAKYFAGTNGYLLQHVREELVNKVGYTLDEIDQAGVKIYTTVDMVKQRQLIDAVNSLPEHQPNLRVAASAVDPKTGAVLAEYGGPDYLKIQRNAATQDVAQAGSTFKPFTLLAALEKGWSISDTISGSSPLMINNHPVKNYGGSSYGTVSLQEATRLSMNTAYVRLNQEVGMDASRQVAIAAGYPKKTIGLDQKSILGVLGTSSPHNIDIAEAYSTFASGGIHRDAHIVSKVTDAQGRVLYEADTAGSRVFKEENIAALTTALRSVVNGGTGKTAGALGRPVAAKTGSSNDNRSAQFVGYIPQMVTAVSLYQVGDKGQEESITPFGGVKEVTGGTWPAKIWLSFMKKATKNMPEEDLFDTQYEKTTGKSFQPKYQENHDEFDDPFFRDPGFDDKPFDMPSF